MDSPGVGLVGGHHGFVNFFDPAYLVALFREFVSGRDENPAELANCRISVLISIAFTDRGGPAGLVILRELATEESHAKTQEILHLVPRFRMTTARLLNGIDVKLQVFTYR